MTTQTIEHAEQTFRDEAHEELVALHDKLVNANRAYWIADAVWPGVYGLTMAGEMLVVVYANGTWECSDDFVDMI